MTKRGPRPIRTALRAVFEGGRVQLWRGSLCIGDLNRLEGRFLAALWEMAGATGITDAAALAELVVASDALREHRPSPEDLARVEPDRGPVTNWWAALDNLRAADRIERNGNCSCGPDETCGQWYCRRFAQQQPEGQAS